MNLLLLCMLYEATFFLLVVVPSPQIPTSCKPSVLQNEDNRYIILLPPLFDFDISLIFKIHFFEDIEVFIFRHITEFIQINFIIIS